MEEEDAPKPMDEDSISNTGAGGGGGEDDDEVCSSRFCLTSSWQLADPHYPFMRAMLPQVIYD